MYFVLFALFARLPGSVCNRLRSQKAFVQKYSVVIDWKPFGYACDTFRQYGTQCRNRRAFMFYVIRVFSRKRLFSKSYSGSSSALISSVATVTVQQQEESPCMMLMDHGWCHCVSGVPRSLMYDATIPSQFGLLLHVIYFWRQVAFGSGLYKWRSCVE